MVRSAGPGQVDDEALAANPVQVEGLVGQFHVPDHRMAEGPVAHVGPGHFALVPQRPGVRALHQQFRAGGSVGGVA